MPTIHPLLILAIGIALVVGLILVLKLNAFLALIVSALAVSLLAPGPLDSKVARVALEFGVSAGKIGIVIAMAAVVGTCLMQSGSADRIVRGFVGLLGEKRTPLALMGSGYVLAIPVFFDTVFYLLVPLARSLHRRTGVGYLKAILAIAAGAAITHTMVPPTPGPLALAASLGVDVGLMIVIGAMVALPASIVGLGFAGWLDRRMPVPMRPVGGGSAGDAEALPEEPVEVPDSELPPLWMAALPVVLPVVLISANTILNLLLKRAGATASPTLRTSAEVAGLLGDPNLALIFAAASALAIYVARRRPSRDRVARLLEESLMSAGIIILITAAGGAFGAMLQAAGISDSVKDLFGKGGGSGLSVLLLGFAVASVLKIAQGSSTVAMITSGGIFAAMFPKSGPEAFAQALGYHPVYLAAAIGCGSLFGSWMNDSGFWIFARMSGLTEAEALKSWTPLLAILGVCGLIVTLILATLMPLA